MIKRAAGENPGRDLSVPYELTIEIEMTDKAVRQLREQSPRYKRVIMKYYMGHTPMHEIARELRIGESMAKEILMRAELQVGRNIMNLEQGLTDEFFGRKIGSASRGERAPRKS